MFVCGNSEECGMIFFFRQGCGCEKKWTCAEGERELEIVLVVFLASYLKRSKRDRETHRRSERDRETER